jgi:MYXO-CTERM domain-containing protein
MTTVAQVDQLVVSDDAVAARLWPKLGPRVQRAYLDDRDRWVALRRRVEAGEALPQATLASEHKVFTGWARAFRAAAPPKQRGATKKKSPGPTAGLAATTAAAAAAVPTPSSPPAAITPGPAVATATPALAAVAKSTGGAGAAAAGGLLALAGLVAFAARRKRS